jgi:6-phosphogluconolactonase
MKGKTLFTILMLVVFVLAGTTVSYAKQDAVGAVYTMTNSTSGNSILVFDRAPGGRLLEAGIYATGGTGTGAGLGNQGGVVLTKDDRWLLVVNAGSSDISIFTVEAGGLRLADVARTVGTMPVSITVDRNLLYVLTAGGSVGAADSIEGFVIGPHGSLSQLPGSSRPLSAGTTGPAQIEFSPDGRLLVVTEKATNNVVVYTVGGDGYVSGMNVYPSIGDIPFGFAFGRRGQLFVSEAFPTVTDGSALSSYVVSRDGALTAVSPSVGTNQSAACWVVVTKGGRFAYTTNAGSGSVSGYKINFDGAVTLLTPSGRTGVTGPGSAPIDMTLSNDGRYLYTLNSGNGTISAFKVDGKGGLGTVDMTAVTGLPPTANGLAAR